MAVSVPYFEMVTMPLAERAGLIVLVVKAGIYVMCLEAHEGVEWRQVNWKTTVSFQQVFAIGNCRLNRFVTDGGNVLCDIRRLLPCTDRRFGAP